MAQRPAVCAATGSAAMLRTITEIKVAISFFIPASVPMFWQWACHDIALRLLLENCAVSKGTSSTRSGRRDSSNCWSLRFRMRFKLLLPFWGSRTVKVTDAFFGLNLLSNECKAERPIGTRNDVPACGPSKNAKAATSSPRPRFLSAAIEGAPEERHSAPPRLPALYNSWRKGQIRCKIIGKKSSPDWSVHAFPTNNSDWCFQCAGVSTWLIRKLGLT